MEHSETIGALALAKAKAQAHFKTITKDESAEVHSVRTGKSYTYSYADLAQCLEAVVPALSDQGLALFQPVRVIDGSTIEGRDGNEVLTAKVSATTLLVHESGEWIKEDFTVPVADASDARSIGSAATYAKRYGLQGLLGIASAEDDDDGQAARGGDHEMAPPQGAKACPACGVVGSLIKSKFGGYVCWKSKGGCETKWPEGNWPTAAPLDQDMTPRQRPAASPAVGGLDPSSESKPADPQAGASDPHASAVVSGAGSIKRTSRPKAEARAPEPEAATRDVGQPVAASTEATVPPLQGQDAAPPAPAGSVIFTIAGTTYETKGMQEGQMRASFDLVVRADKLIGKGYARGVLAKILGCKPEAASRTEATEEQAAAWLEALAQAIAEEKK